MASVGVFDDDRSGGSVSRRLGLQKRKRQEKWAIYPRELRWGRSCRRGTRSSKGKEKHIQDDAYYRPGIIKENLDTWAFDIDDDYVPFPLPYHVTGSVHIPIPNLGEYCWLHEQAQLCSSKAIDIYNKKHKAEYHFVKVDKLAYKMFWHYITFDAVVERKDAAVVYSKFQAIVCARPGDTKDAMEVVLCRLKPNA
ncbi:hypothetical protein RHSIM_Rhsim06G0005500 [Rhododendron simsii]|uniref:Uncharacterized protein n=1 Tax=Rhododendron simsii TaxID=118357 RepID=A0A834GUH0_RHOSS|nr:hypothetical protein RHSIM_Rhsim06G0005500 [Rhododendron simsii]